LGTFDYFPKSQTGSPWRRACRITYIVPLYPLVKGEMQRTLVTEVSHPLVRPSSLTITTGLQLTSDGQWTMDNKKGEGLSPRLYV